MKPFVFSRTILYVFCPVLLFLFTCGTAAAGEIHLYVMPHGDDIIQISAKIYDDIHPVPPSDPPEVHVLFTGNDAASVEKAKGFISQYLGIDRNNIDMLSKYGPIEHRKVIVKELVEKLVALSPDKVFIQGWCGSHPEHEMNHMEVVRAVELAEESTGFTTEIYEFPTFTGYYGRLPSEPTIEELSDYWNSLIDLDPRYHTQNVTIPVDESKAALKAKAKMIWNWEIPWMRDLIENYNKKECLFFISQEKFRLLGNYNYLERPYPLPKLMSYEFLYEWPYVFDDFCNYKKTLHEEFGADLWTDPHATHKEIAEEIDPGQLYDELKVYLENPAHEADVFTLSAAWGENRIPAGNTVGFRSWSVSVDAGQTVCVDGWIDPTGYSGYKVLWIKAVSEKASQEQNSLTNFTEIPFEVNITSSGSF